MVTYGPEMFGLIREVAAIQMTSIKRSFEVRINVIDHIIEVLVKTAVHFNKQRTMAC